MGLQSINEDKILIFHVDLLFSFVFFCFAHDYENVFSS